MKTPITYYGGKQQLAARIIALIPSHSIYVEPFIGGGAVFWAKPPSKVECINDINGEVVNFYHVIKTDFSALQREVQSYPHSRAQYKRAKTIYKNPDRYDSVARAWAFWYLCNGSYGCGIGKGWGYNLSGDKSIDMMNKRAGLISAYANRLETVYIECYDAIKIIKSWDTPETFFYCDPPYPDTAQGHYKGYDQADFNKLLDALSEIKGKFLLSSYKNETLTKYAGNNHWHTLEIEMHIPMNANNDSERKKKTELLTYNYTPFRDELFQIINEEEINE
jgi:DNA adenine methylase